MSRSATRTVLVLVALALAACTSPTAPTNRDCSGGVVTGTGQCMTH